MDKKESLKELNEDVTRESLIAISYRVPETDLAAENLPQNLDFEKVVEPLIFDADDIYRCKLISLSYSPPSDVKVLPPLPGKLNP